MCWGSQIAPDQAWVRKKQAQPTMKPIPRATQITLITDVFPYVCVNFRNFHARCTQAITQDPDARLSGVVCSPQHNFHVFWMAVVDQVPRVFQFELVWERISLSGWFGCIGGGLMSFWQQQKSRAKDHYVAQCRRDAEGDH